MIPSGRDRFLVLATSPESLVRFRGHLLRALQARGYEVHVAAAELSTTPPWRDELDAWGIVRHDIDVQRTGMNPIADFVALRQIVGLCRCVRPAAVLSYTVKPVLYGMIGAAIARVPRRFALITGLGLSFSEGGGGRRRTARLVSSVLYRASLGCASHVFFQNPDDEGLFRATGILPAGVTSSVVKGSGIDTCEFRDHPLPAGPPRFTLIGRMLGTKGVREFAAAARHLRREGVHAGFHLVGGAQGKRPDSVPEDEIRGWVSDGILLWHGRVKDVRPHLADSHMLVLPTAYREGIPRTILEAMAMGRGVITTDAPGCREAVVDGENGLLVEPRSVEALIAALRRVIAAPELMERFAAVSRRRAVAEFDVHLVNEAMLRWMVPSASTGPKTASAPQGTSSA